MPYLSKKKSYIESDIQIRDSIECFALSPAI